jgi:hypothetical protein
MPAFTPAQTAAVLAVVVGIPALYFLAGWFIGRRRQVCPTCSRRALRCVQWIRATVLIEGRRAPDSWSYFLCESCGAHFKRHIGREFEVPSEAEWAQYCAHRV